MAHCRFVAAGTSAGTRSYAPGKQSNNQWFKIEVRILFAPTEIQGCSETRASVPTSWRFRDGVAGFLRESVVLRCAPSCSVLVLQQASHERNRGRAAGYESGGREFE